MIVTKTHILNEIKRTAAENDHTPLGWRRFSEETGIKLDDLYKNSLARYSDACILAGYVPNKLTIAYIESELLDKYANLVKELGRLPGKGDLRVKTHADSSFPHDKTLSRGLGGKTELITKLLIYCRSRPEFATVVQLCESYMPRNLDEPNDSAHQEGEIGYVYLVKHGARREFKIGRTNNALRREGEISIELPERVKPVHVISTDDPAGIEAYWHRRFADKRKNGEWFELTVADVTAFKRRKFM
jgi:hypothetical protein